MHRGFKLGYSSMFDHPDKDGKTYAQQKKIILDALDSYITGEPINVEKLVNQWFPNVQADVFISHSHADESEAIAFADWLKRTFGISSFIDSSVWGNSKDLLTKIHNLCVKSTKANGVTNYDFIQSNRACEIVNMMLANALTQMLDRCECIFFLDTPNSITTKSLVEGSEPKTKSPWIYHEICTTKTIRRNIPDRHKVIDKQAMLEGKLTSFSANLDQFEFPANTKHLNNLSSKQLENWAIKTILQPKNSGTEYLDLLYEKISPNNENT